MVRVVSEFEGTLLKNHDVFSYFMLVAFEASGLVRFALLLALWPVIRFLEALGREDDGLKLAIFVATAGLPLSEIEAVARAVLPKFYMDDVDIEAWRVLISYNKRVVVTRMPRVMVEMFVIEHLRADGVVGSELSTNHFGLATGFARDDFVSMAKGVARVCGDEEPLVGLGRTKSRCGSFFLPLCKERVHSPFNPNTNPEIAARRPHPVIFHDGRLALRPNPSAALLVLLWIPLGALLAFARISVGLLLPIRAASSAALFLGCQVKVRGTPPAPFSGRQGSGILYVCTHRTLMDPVVLSSVLGRRVPAVTYSISRFSEILSPIPTFRLARARDADGRRIKRQLDRGDLALCPEGTTCREPFLLRFSALFAELTNRIVPVAMNCRAGLFHATTARGWKAMDPVFFFMNPRPAYEVTFLKQLPAEATCAAGRSPHEVANNVQRMLAATLGFECTNLTRKDKYRALAGNDGIVSPASSSFSMKEFVDGLKRVVGGGFYDSLGLKI